MACSRCDEGRQSDNHRVLMRCWKRRGSPCTEPLWLFAFRCRTALSPEGRPSDFGQAADGRRSGLTGANGSVYGSSTWGSIWPNSVGAEGRDERSIPKSRHSARCSGLSRPVTTGAFIVVVTSACPKQLLRRADVAARLNKVHDETCRSGCAGFVSCAAVNSRLIRSLKPSAQRHDDVRQRSARAFRFMIGPIDQADATEQRMRP
jgi:hypothetical protein